MTNTPDTSPEGYIVKKSSGRRGYQWTCPKGFNHYNFESYDAAYQDMMTIYRAAIARATGEKP